MAARCRGALLCSFWRGVSVAQTGVITTIVGNGAASFNGDGGPGTSTELTYPSGVAVDSGGNVFIADRGNWRVRLWTRRSGAVTTIAGSALPGFGGDGGPGTSARLSRPDGVAVDGAGNVYISDSSNFRVRAWNASTGDITTIVGNGVSGFSGDGGPGTSASLNLPGAVAVDAAGNVYISDTLNHRVRMWTRGTGIVTTLVGTGESSVGGIGDGGPGTSAAVYLPGGLTVDAAGNVYVVALNRVRKWTKSTGIITTVVGNGSNSFSGDGGAGASATLSLPNGVASDAAGNLYIADAGNLRVRLWNASSGAISTIAGNGSMGFSGDGAAATSATLGDFVTVAVDAAGSVLVITDRNMRVRLVTLAGVPSPIPSGGPTSTPSAAAAASLPATLAGTPGSTGALTATVAASPSGTQSQATTALSRTSVSTTLGATPSPESILLAGEPAAVTGASLSPGAIIGIVLSTVGGLMLAAIAAVFVVRMKRGPLSSAKRAEPGADESKESRVAPAGGPRWAQNPISQAGM